MPNIEAGAAGDRAAIETLLTSEGLPLAGLADAQELLLCRDGTRVIACAAIEVYDDGGLLRSVAVSPAHCGTGIGRAVIEAATDRARALGLPALFLLTTTAADYFPRFGFAPVERDEVPAGVRRSIEFTSACPASAVVMQRSLRGE